MVAEEISYQEKFDIRPKNIRKGIASSHTIKYNYAHDHAIGNVVIKQDLRYGDAKTGKLRRSLAELCDNDGMTYNVPYSLNKKNRWSMMEMMQQALHKTNYGAEVQPHKSCKPIIVYDSDEEEDAMKIAIISKDMISPKRTDKSEWEVFKRNKPSIPDEEEKQFVIVKTRKGRFLKEVKSSKSKKSKSPKLSHDHMEKELYTIHETSKKSPKYFKEGLSKEKFLMTDTKKLDKHAWKKDITLFSDFNV
jgi:hypothetical protein